MVLNAGTREKYERYMRAKWRGEVLTLESPFTYETPQEDVKATQRQSSFAWSPRALNYHSPSCAKLIDPLTSRLRGANDRHVAGRGVDRNFTRPPARYASYPGQYMAAPTNPAA